MKSLHFRLALVLALALGSLPACEKKGAEGNATVNTSEGSTKAKKKKGKKNGSKKSKNSTDPNTSTPPPAAPSPQ